MFMEIRKAMPDTISLVPTPRTINERPGPVQPPSTDLQRARRLSCSIQTRRSFDGMRRAFIPGVIRPRLPCIWFVGNAGTASASPRCEVRARLHPQRPIQYELHTDQLHACDTRLVYQVYWFVKRAPGRDSESAAYTEIPAGRPDAHAMTV